MDSTPQMVPVPNPPSCSSWFGGLTPPFIEDKISKIKPKFPIAPC